MQKQMKMRLHEKLVDCKFGTLGLNPHRCKSSEASPGTKLPAAPKMPSVGPRPIIKMCKDLRIVLMRFMARMTRTKRDVVAVSHLFMACQMTWICQALLWIKRLLPFSLQALHGSGAEHQLLLIKSLDPYWWLRLKG